MLRLSLIASLILAVLAHGLPCSAAEPDVADISVGNAADTNATSATNASAESNTQLLRALLLVQEQLRATQRQVEQAREEADAAGRRSAEVLAARLNLIEQTLTAQRQREFDALQGSNQLVLIGLGGAGALALVAILFVGWSQTRAVSRLSEISQHLQILPALAGGARPRELPNGEHSNGHAIEHSTEGLLSSVERLTKRLDELETASGAATTAERNVASNRIARVNTTIAKGQTLLNLDKAADALTCFDEVLALDPANVEAWIKRGTALEKLQRVDEAIAAYDRAIAADESTATAYLFKAGVYNRQKRYAEALQCYEKALHAQKSRAA